MSKPLPLVFACAGCSHAGRLAYDLALELERRGIAEMSCLAGIGAAKPLFMSKLCDREVWIIDGCPIECSLGVFDQVRAQVDVHIRLHEMGVRKNSPDPDEPSLDDVVELALQQAAEQRRLRR